MKDRLVEVAEKLRQMTRLVDDTIVRFGTFELIVEADALVKIEWHTRDETPPAGMIWASDGYGIWTLKMLGEPIPASATAVKYWAVALIPKPPLLEQQTWDDVRKTAPLQITEGDNIPCDDPDQSREFTSDEAQRGPCDVNPPARAAAIECKEFLCLPEHNPAHYDSRGRHYPTFGEGSTDGVAVDDGSAGTPG